MCRDRHGDDHGDLRVCGPGTRLPEGWGDCCLTLDAIIAGGNRPVGWLRPDCGRLTPTCGRSTVDSARDDQSSAENPSDRIPGAETR